MRERRNSSLLATELRLSCTNPSIYLYNTFFSKIFIKDTLYLTHEAEVCRVLCSWTDLYSVNIFKIWKLFHGFRVETVWTTAWVWHQQASWCSRTTRRLGFSSGKNTVIHIFRIDKLISPLRKVSFQKNIKRHTTHTIVSWPNPKQWIIVHTSDLMMIIRQSNIFSQPSRGNWVNWKHTAPYIE